MSAAGATNEAALMAKAGPVPTAAIKPPTAAEAMIWTNRPVDQATELAARHCCSVVSAGMTACTVGLKKAFPAANRAAIR